MRGLFNLAIRQHRTRCQHSLRFLCCLLFTISSSFRGLAAQKTHHRRKAGQVLFLSAFSVPDRRTVRTPKSSHLVPPAACRALAFRSLPSLYGIYPDFIRGAIGFGKRERRYSSRGQRLGKQQLCVAVPGDRTGRQSQKEGRHGIRSCDRIIVTRRRSGGRLSGECRPVPATSARQSVEDAG
jgi:hypothetical protein